MSGSLLSLCSWSDLLKYCTVSINLSPIPDKFFILLPWFENSYCCMGRPSNCLKVLYFSIGMHYEGAVCLEYLSCPQVHLTSWGDVLQSAQSRQAVLWVVGI